MSRWLLGLSVTTVVLSVAFGSAAEAARRRASVAVRGPDTPEIRSSAANPVPHCVTPDRLMAFMRSQNDQLDGKFQTIATDYKRHGDALRIRWDFAFYQMLLETNYLKFRRGDGSPGDVKPKQNNFAGIGATGNGVPGDSYPDVSTGVLAQMQHLVAYSGEMVADPVAPRTREVQDGVVAQSRRLGRPVKFADLTNRWAADRTYARSIIMVSERFMSGFCNSPEPAPIVSAAPEAPRGSTLARKAVDTEPNATRAALGATVIAGAAAAVPSGGACQVMSASFGGAVTLLIRAETAKGVTLTALDVDGGNEDQQAAAYISSHAPGGKVTGRFHNRTEAVNHAYGLCDSGRP